MKDFFRYVTDIPAGSGFELFGVCHIRWLIVIAVFTVFLCVVYNKAGRSNNSNMQSRIRIIIGIIMPLISIYRDVVLMLTGHFDRYYLPLHLCGMALWIGALYCFTRWRFAGVVYVLLCVPGALSALIFPDWVDYPFWNYMHIHDFTSHGLIVAWGICLLVSGEVVPEWKELWMPVVFGVAGVVILTPVNKWLGTNYWFLGRPSPGSPLVSIMSITGENWYMAGYILLVAFVLLIWLCIISLIRNVQMKLSAKLNHISRNEHRN